MCDTNKYKKAFVFIYFMTVTSFPTSLIANTRE